MVYKTCTVALFGVELSVWDWLLVKDGTGTRGSRGRAMACIGSSVVIGWVSVVQHIIRMICHMQCRIHIASV